ncbi:long-chain fatty acid--CoA ligase [Mycobacterium sp. IS-3022]|uniref:long-chain-fatty-acid--CoA ligase n=1 Tax=Mycobacterium sp. IS-3022 TaxID=1772277 RepID=UPI0007416CC9|nr:long-chain fatty acid--CoA ligase [Mycobacterium sp. IS-3022]KUI01808.1 long-chain fatty acid--CoA ligase [Mycobacterium sp. IS-3022]
MSRSLATVLESTAEKFPDRVALIDGDLRLSYAEVNAAANRMANLLVTLGLGKGDTLALSCPNMHQFPTVYFGALKAGLTVVPLNVLLTKREIAYQLQDSGAKAYVAFEGAPELPIGDASLGGFREAGTCAHFIRIAADGPRDTQADDVLDLATELERQPSHFNTVDVEDRDVALVLYTSGTSGQPKGAELTHEGMRLSALVGRETIGADPNEPDVFLCALPLSHVFAQTGILNTAFTFGGTIVLTPRFDEQVVLDLLSRHGVTVFHGVPTMYVRILEALQAGPSTGSTAVSTKLRKALSGGASLPAAVQRRLHEQFGIEVLEGYGISETCGVVCCMPAGAGLRPGSVGLPLPCLEVRLIDVDGSAIEKPDVVGEVAARGPVVFNGYRGRRAETAEALVDGWFRTGDLARRDEDGLYYLIDRKKDLILRGGYNVYPREVEEVLADHPAVALAAVIGIPDDDHGEEIKAFVVRSGALTEDELRGWARERLAAYKYPRTIEFVDSLPLTNTGKILKRALPRDRPATS